MLKLQMYGNFVFRTSIHSLEYTHDAYVANVNFCQEKQPPTTGATQNHQIL